MACNVDERSHAGSLRLFVCSSMTLVDTDVDCLISRSPSNAKAGIRHTLQSTRRARTRQSEMPGTTQTWIGARQDNHQNRSNSAFLGFR